MVSGGSGQHMPACCSVPLSTVKHLCRAMVYALSLSSGSTLPGWPVDVETGMLELSVLTHVHALVRMLSPALSFRQCAATAALAGQTFLSINQNQRGALTLLNDTVYVPYGGMVVHTTHLGVVQVLQPAVLLDESTTC